LEHLFQTSIIYLLIPFVFFFCQQYIILYICFLQNQTSQEIFDLISTMPITARLSIWIKKKEKLCMCECVCVYTFMSLSIIFFFFCLFFFFFLCFSFVFSNSFQHWTNQIITQIRLDFKYVTNNFHLRQVFLTVEEENKMVNEGGL
jgi:hypothetical protein